MLADRTSTRTVATTLDENSTKIVRMTIKQDAISHVMNVVTDMYADPKLAVVREYSTNARDAHIVAGQPLPIEVSLPSMLSPYFQVRDYGDGLSPTDIETIYSAYGSSTKRETNDLQGTFGLGCKSALAYTDQFTVQSVKNGRAIIVSVERDEDGAGVMKVVSNDPNGDPTMEPNGTTITVPVQAGDAQAFAEKAESLFRVWPEGSVLVNGAQPARVEGLWLTDKLVVIDGETSYIVMGDVPYPHPINAGLPRRGYQYGYGVIEQKSIMAFVDIGSVTIPGARESLIDTRRTRETVARVENEARRALHGAVQREIDKAATPREAAMTYHKFAKPLGQDSGSYTYKGQALVKRFEPAQKLSFTKNGSTWCPAIGITKHSTQKLSRMDGADDLPLGQWDDTLIVWGFDRAGMTPTVKRKLLKHVEDSVNFSVSRFAMVAVKPSADQIAYLGADHIVPWTTIDAIKLPRQASATSQYGRLPGSYDFLRGLSQAEWDAAQAAVAAGTVTSGYANGANEGHVHETGIPGAQIDQSKPIFYVHGRYGAAAQYIAALATEHRETGCYIVCLGANRIEKFCRIIPTAKTARAGVRDAWKRVSATITDAERLALHVRDHEDHGDLRKLDADRLDDPDLKEAIRIAKTNTDEWAKRRQKFSRMVDTGTLNPVSWSSPLDKYPLFQEFYETYRSTAKFSDDMYLYMNCKFRSITNKGA